MSSQRVRVRDATFSVQDEGHGETIVLLHGFPLNKTMWEAQVDALAASYRLLIPDLRGHGESTVTPGIVTMEAMSEDLEELLSALNVNGPISLCGLSMGGYVAWEFWRRAPARLKRLVLLDTRAASDSVEVARAREIMASQVIQNGSQEVAQSMLPKLFANATLTGSPEKVETVRQMILATDAQGIAATQRGMARRRDATPMLSEIDVPTLVVCGTEDRISPPEEMRHIADSMPQAQFVEIANAGHLAPLEQPDSTNHAIREFFANT